MRLTDGPTSEKLALMIRAVAALTILVQLLALLLGSYAQQACGMAGQREAQALVGRGAAEFLSCDSPCCAQEQQKIADQPSCCGARPNQDTEPSNDSDTSRIYSKVHTKAANSGAQHCPSLSSASLGGRCKCSSSSIPLPQMPVDGGRYSFSPVWVATLSRQQAYAANFEVDSSTRKVLSPAFQALPLHNEFLTLFCTRQT